MKRAAAAAAVFLALTCLFLVGAFCLIEKTMPDYPDGIGSDPGVVQKITGEYLVKTAAAEPDTLLIYGSSELKTTDICTHPANFFADKRCGFQVDLVGRGSCQSLVHAMSIAAGGEAMNGKKAVLITAPQSYVAEGIAPDLFMANFSEQQTLSFLTDESIPEEIRSYLANRIRTLNEQYRDSTGTDILRGTVAGLLTRTADSGIAAALLRPMASAAGYLLRTKDLVVSRQIMGDYTDTTPVPQTVDWDAELEKALEQAHEMSTNNDYYMQDSYYSTYIGARLAQQEGRDAGLRYDVSPEYEDLRCLFEICRARNMDILFVHVPMHGSWCDYTGFDTEARADYYDRVRDIASEYNNVTVLDLTQWEYEPYFLCDTMHLGWKGWLEVDRAIAAFYGSDA